METEVQANYTYMGRSFDDLSINDDSSSAFSDCNSDRSGEFPTTSSQSRRLLLACTSENSDDLIPQLVSDLESCSIEGQKQAAMQIRLLAKNKPENRIKIAQAGAIRPLISLISSSDPQLQENGVTAILNLSLCDENKELIASSGAIRPLVRALKVGTSTAKENAACALLRLSQVEENKIAIGRSGAIPLLVNLLDTGNFRGKKDASTALYLLCSVKENKIRAVEAGIMKPLVELMADFESNMVDKSAFVMNVLVSVAEARTALVVEGGIPVLVDKKSKAFSLNYTPRPRRRPRPLSHGSIFCNFRPPLSLPLRATSTNTALVEEAFESEEVLFKEKFPLKRTQKGEGKISIRLDNGKDQENWQLTVGCNLPGKWVLHWGVNYVNDIGSEWDQPPVEMRPPDSILIKDYAIETPLKKSSAVVEGDLYYEVKINFSTNRDIAAINFVLKDEETGAWYQHKGRDFMVVLIDNLHEDGNFVGAKKGLGIWPGALGQLSSVLLKSEGAHPKGEDSSESRYPNQKNKSLEGFYEEHSIVREVLISNSVTVSVRKCPEMAKNLLYMETDLPGDVVVHWGVCKDDGKKWEIPAEPYPAETIVFKNKALRTLLKKKGGHGGSSLFTLDEGYLGFLFVLKLNDNTWLNCMGNDFYIPLSSSSGLSAISRHGQSEGQVETNQVASPATYTDEIIDDIRNLVTDISSEKGQIRRMKEAQESILQEIEKLAAEAYSIFRSSIPTFSEKVVVESEEILPAVKICSATGSGFEILCQGFNWESHKSRRWYMELHEKVAELSSLGFTVVWLPPPTDSVSPEGYMPKDLYNLNSRYGSTDELKGLVKRFHEVNNIRVLGDAVLNHRCAEYQNQNGVWNIFGGRLNWDDRAVVADDPHFQGKGNKSSGDCFHAAPNIDHSQEFVRKDLKEWLCWLREEIGYDGWRLDFVRGFWGGYVKDYIEASEPYFAVGEYWDSLNYTYGEMDHNQDAHRQRIVDWINDTNGTAAAFDVTTKGILHAALERCEYWRLSDQKGRPPGVVGWWPSRAVTFIENHDTGSTQGHWRFPGGKEMQGYAYILTHPGTPAVFYDHIFSHMKSEISELISLRNRNKIHCRSTIKITKAERDVYAAVIEEKVAMKIGPGHYEPPSGPGRWSLAIEGRDYKVWEAS